MFRPFNSIETFFLICGAIERGGLCHILIHFAEVRQSLRMAEYVEQRMEEMLGEVEQMERVNLLEPKEVKELIKKRKHFEYKIQKKTKEKGDFLGYIQYETNLLSLLAMRRESTGYEHKKSEIEGAIRVRINKLFKILEHRFQSDVSVWLSHIHFLKSSGWEASVSRIYLRMLQVA